MNCLLQHFIQNISERTPGQTRASPTQVCYPALHVLYVGAMEGVLLMQMDLTTALLSDSH